MSANGRNENGKVTSRISSTSRVKGRKPYKVVLESVTQEKKRLVSSVSYEVQAPSGYTYVPVGTPDLTEYCKELCRKRGLSVYVVTAADKGQWHKNPESISHHIHRVGHHFPNKVVEQACDWYGYRHRNRRYIQDTANSHLGSFIAKKLDNQGRRMGLVGDDISSVQRTKQVEATVRELFPGIPDADLDAIVSRAFEEGTNRVGNADHLPLSRRVQLAVVAHIRHTYTDYDALLRIVSWHQARAMVEQCCLDQIVKWRGLKDDGVVELEDIFQEVIVLEDDDDEDVEETDEDPEINRQSSLEIVSHRKLSTDLGDGLSDANGNGLCQNQDSLLQLHSRPVAHADLVHVQPRRNLPPPRMLDQQELYRRYEQARIRNGLITNNAVGASSGEVPSDTPPGMTNIRDLPWHFRPQEISFHTDGAALPPRYGFRAPPSSGVESRAKANVSSIKGASFSLHQPMQKSIALSPPLRRQGGLVESQTNASQISLRLNEPQFYDKEVYPLHLHSRPVFAPDGKALHVSDYSSQRAKLYPRVAGPAPVPNRDVMYHSVEPPTSSKRPHDWQADGYDTKRNSLPAISYIRAAGEYTMIPQPSRKRQRIVAIHDSPVFVSSQPGRQYDHDPANKRITAHGYVTRNKNATELEVVDLTLSPPESNRRSRDYPAKVALRPLYVRSVEDFSARRAADVISNGVPIKARERLPPEQRNRPFYVDDSRRREPSAQQPPSFPKVRLADAQQGNLPTLLRGTLVTVSQDRFALNTTASSNESYPERDHCYAIAASQIVHGKQSNDGYTESRQPYLTDKSRLDIQDLHDRDRQGVLPIWESGFKASGQYSNHERHLDYRNTVADSNGGVGRSRSEIMTFANNALQPVSAEQFSGYHTVLSHRPKGQQ